MKFINLVVVFLLCLNLVCATGIDLDLYKSTYSSGETVQAEILYNISLESVPSSLNFAFYLNDTKISTSLSLIKISRNHHFLYFNIPVGSVESNYTLKLENIIYLDNGVLKQEDFSFPLEVDNEGFALSLNPAGVYVSEIGPYTSFSFELYNQGLGVLDVNISGTDFLIPSVENLILQTGMRSTFDISVSSLANIEKDSVVLNYGNLSYEIPFWLPVLLENEPNKTFSQEADVVFLDYLGNEISEITKVLEHDEYIDTTLYIRNNQNFSLDDLSVVVSESLGDVVSYSLGDYSLEGNEEISAPLAINYFPGGNPSAGSYFGNISIFQNLSLVLSLPLQITVLEEGVVVPPKVLPNEKNMSDGFNYTYPVEEEGSSSWIFWLVFLFIVFVIFSFLLIYYFKKKRPKDFEAFIAGLKH